MNNRICAALTLVFATICVTDPASAFQQKVNPQACGNLAQYASRLSQEFGWTRAQAIGALANFAHESRGRAIEQVGMPAGSGGFGWAQWTGARRYAFMAFARASGMSPASDGANYAFLAHELRTNFAFVAQRMKQARSTAEATTIFARDYEGAFSPGAIASMSSRHQWARALDGMTGGTAAPTNQAAAPGYAAAPQILKTAAPVHRPTAPTYRVARTNFRTAAPIYRAAVPTYQVAYQNVRTVMPTYRAVAPAYYGRAVRSYKAATPSFRMMPRIYGAMARPYRVAAR